MQKLTTEPTKEGNRNSSFHHTSTKISVEEVGQLPPIRIQEVKTLRMVAKKTNRIPFLNLAQLRDKHKPRVLSLNVKEYEKLRTQRKSTNGNTEDVSFFLHQCDLLITKKNTQNANDLKKPSKKSVALPPIMHHGHTSPAKFGNNQNTQEVKRKGPRNKVHCKVLLAKNNDFPFMKSHVYENRRIGRSKTKQISNPEHIEFFDLDISRISEVQEPPTIEFISQESFKQIVIF